MGTGEKLDDPVKAYWRAKRAKRLALGLCERCGNDHRPGKTLCQECADRGAVKMREKRRRKSAVRE